MKWNIVADSSCDIFTLKDIAPDTGFTTIPFEITIGEKNFVDDENLDIEEMMQAMYASKAAAGSACPGPGKWEGGIFKSRLFHRFYNFRKSLRQLLFRKRCGA